ncbi:serine/threonine-protein phosphatase [Microbispora triticiradicis]|uniref:Serine/threonine-protein phosphatase n=1 Tax=Microbispora triticiradicis TaxID=2200763 RepID=A0ABX9LHJ4_9ACTN|nr:MULTISPECIES: PP2C family protein-serine/threonine phosphatase [Microbispora]RGA02594.1 serine/threonine-protein phosphatase [Microbispora triticiradicis]
MVGVVGGAKPALPPADSPDVTPVAAPVGTLPAGAPSGVAVPEPGPAEYGPPPALLEPVPERVPETVADAGGRRWAELVVTESWRQTQEARERAAEERRVTLALREAILPEPGASIELPYARIAVRYVPAGRESSLGGDWYDAAPLPDGRMFLAVGDVSGHGLPAIAEMAQLRHALLGLSMTGASPGMLLSWLNALVLTRLDDTTATAVCGHFDPASRLFTWAQAGHPAPILVRRGGVRQLGAPRGVVLGATSSLPYGVADVRLEPGDLLLMFTDGLVERRSRDIGAGVSLVMRAAASTGATGADLDASLDRLLEAIGGPNPEDDTCLLAVAVTGDGPRTA